ncbi:MAG: hypothetical protein ACC608_12560 [Anaerofustis sp.]
MNEKKGVIDRIWKGYYMIESDDHTIIKVPIAGEQKWKDGDRIVYAQTDGQYVLRADTQERDPIDLKRYFKK